MIDLVKVGRKIAHYREERGYSQEGLARKLYVTRQAISNWEIGKSTPSIDNVVELSKVFSVPFEDILCLGEEATFDRNDIFHGHDRQYVIRSIINGTCHLELKDVIYQCTGEERLALARAIANGTLKADRKDLWPMLTDEEKRLAYGGNKI